MFIPQFRKGAAACFLAVVAISLISARAQSDPAAESLSLLSNSSRLALATAQLGDRNTAISMLKTATDAAQKKLGAEHPEVLSTRTILANLYLADDKPEKSAEVLESVVDSYRKKGNEQRAYCALSSVGRAYDQMHQFEKALVCHERAIALASARFGTESEEFASILEGIGGHWVSQKNFSKALPIFERALAIEEKKNGKDSPELVDTLMSLGAICHQLKNEPTAVAFTEQALQIAKKKLGPDDEATRAAREQIELLRKAAGGTGN